MPPEDKFDLPRPSAGVGKNKLSLAARAVNANSSGNKATEGRTESAMDAVVRSVSQHGIQETVTSGSIYNPTLPTEVPLNEIWREDVQVRLVHVDNAVQNLAKSIKEIGLQQPIVVRRKVNPRNNKQCYCIVAGHTRFKSYQLLFDETNLEEFSRIPTIKVEITDKKLLELQLAENEERYELLPIEVARALTILYNEYKLQNPHLTERDFVHDKQRKYQANFVSMVKIMNLFHIYNKIETLEWFGSLNIKWANIADDLLKLFQALIRAKKIQSFEQFKDVLIAEKEKNNFEELDQRSVRAMITDIKKNLLGVGKVERAKKDSDIQHLCEEDDYKNLVSEGSIYSLGATIQYAIKESEKQDIGAFLKAVGEKIGEQELGEMLFVHLHK